MVTRLVGGVHRCLLGREGSALARSTEAERTGALPGKRVALSVGDGHDGVVERGLDVNQSIGHILAFALLELLVLAGLAGSALLLASPLGLRRRFLTVRDRTLTRTLAGARVGVGALAARRQVATMAEPTIGLNVDQALDVHRDVFAEVAFDIAFVLNRLTDAVYLVFAEILDLLERVHIGRLPGCVAHAGCRYRKCRSARFVPACGGADRRQQYVPC